MKKNSLLTALLLYILPFTVMAQSPTPTVVFGQSQTAKGKEDSFLIVQPADGGNPLGNPIVTPIEQTSPLRTPTAQRTPIDQAQEPTDVISQSAAQDPAPFSETSAQQQNQIQNTLYQGGDRIYDVQSYPIKDIKTITEPNIQPTITTYPEY